jgi:membrane-bound serine protease (ClpP class)
MILTMETVMTLLVAGAVLVLLETVLPGMIAGIVGLLCLLAGVILGYNEFGPRSGNLILCGVLAGLIIGTLAWLKFFPNSRLGKIFVSQGAVGEIRTEKPELLNQTGTALTPLRPSGAALIDGKRVDVVTEGAHVGRGTPIKVVAVEGMRVVVRAV